MAHSLADLPLAELTARLRADAVSRGSGELRDDMVVLAVRPTQSAGSKTEPSQSATRA